MKNLPNMKPFRICSCSLVFIFFLIQGTVLSQDKIKTENLERIGRYFTVLLNNPDKDSISILLPEIFTLKDTTQETIKSYIQKFEEMNKESGGVILNNIRISPNGIHVIVRQVKTGLWKDYQLIRDHSNNKTKGIFVADITEPIEIPATPVTDAVTLEWLEKYINKLVDNYDFSGSVLLAKNGKDFFSKYSGYADRKNKIIIDKNARFNLASGSKMFTVVSIFQLLQQNKISLSDKLNKFLPDYADEEFANEVTISELLTHTSGLGDYWDESFENSWDTIKTLTQYLPFITKQKINFQPGNGVQYSNSAFILLGLIIENVSGENYINYVEKNVLQPLKMNNTGFFDRRQKDQHNAIEYSKDKSGKQWVQTDRISPYGSSAGGAYSTAEDILKFNNALSGHKLLNKKFTDLLLSDQVRVPGTQNFWYSFGFEINYQNDHHLVGKSGQAPGSNFFYATDEDNNITVVICCNEDNPAFDDLKRI